MPLNVRKSGPDHSPDRDQAWKQAMADGAIRDSQAFAAFMLEKTSRTFALNIQVLPAGLRRQVLLAYLFCRMADTLEDDGDLDEASKVRLLESFRGLFPSGSAREARDLEGRLASFRAQLPSEWGQSERWDQLLVHHCHWILPQLREFPADAVDAISRCVEEMCSGMIDFTRRQARTRDGQVLIETVADLDRYCYYVAGTVGNLLCDLFTLHSPLIGASRAKSLRTLSVSFGLGLQLTNILKDVQEDRGRNVSFIPSSLLNAAGLGQKEFLSGARDEAVAEVMAALLSKAQTHLRDAMDYTCLLPRLEPRLRLFCLWPLFMAAENLVVMAAHLDVGQSEGKLKITRRQVKGIVGRTSMACWSNLWLRSMFRDAMSRLDACLAAIPAGKPAIAMAVRGSGSRL